MKKLLFVFVVVIGLGVGSLWGQAPSLVTIPINSSPIGVKVEVMYPDTYDFTYHDLGITPCNPTFLENKNFNLKFSKDGYITKTNAYTAEKDMSITVYLAKEININFNITPSTGIKITATHRDTNGSIISGGTNIYYSVADLNTYKFITLDKYDITVEKTGYETYKTSFSAYEGYPNIMVTLKKRIPTTINATNTTGTTIPALVNVYCSGETVALATGNAPLTVTLIEGQSYDISFEKEFYLTEKVSYTSSSETYTKILTDNKVSRKIVSVPSGVNFKIYGRQETYVTPPKDEIEFDKARNYKIVLWDNDNKCEVLIRDLSSTEINANDTISLSLIPTVKKIEPINWKAKGIGSNLPTDARANMESLLKTTFGSDKNPNTTFPYEYMINNRLSYIEQQYYFIQNSTLVPNDINNANNEYICLGVIDFGGEAHYKMLRKSSSPIDEEYYATYNSKISFAWISKVFSWTTSRWHQYDQTHTVDEDKKGTFKVYEGDVQDTGTFPIISKDIFMDTPININDSQKKEEEKYFTITFTSDFTKHDNTVGSYFEDGWNSTYCNYTLYKAKDALPHLNEIFDKPFIEDSSLIDTAHHQQLNEITIFTQYGVKILGLQFYKYNAAINNYEIVTDKTIITTTYDKTSPDGINNIVIPKVHMTTPEGKYIEGKYMMVLGIVDKFNKIYSFEPQYFVIDTTAPTINETVTSKTNFGSTDTPEIVSWTSLSDNYTAYTEISDYFYVRLADMVNPIRLKEVGNFKIENNKILLNEGQTHIKELFVRDIAGNRKDLISQEIVFNYDKVSPTFSSTVDTTKCYKSTDSINITIDEISDILVDSLYISYGLISRMSIDMFNKVLLVGLSQLDKDFVMGCYHQLITDNYYELKSDLSEIDKNKLITICNGIKYNILYDTTNYSSNKKITVPFDFLKETTGKFNIYLKVKDIVGNVGEYSLDNLAIDEHAPKLKVSIKDVANSYNIEDKDNIDKELIDIKIYTDKVLLNQSKTLSIEIIEDNLKDDGLKVDITTNYNPTINNKLGQTATTYTLIKNSTNTEPYEIVKVNITASDKTDKTINEEYVFWLYNDTTAPIITKTGTNGAYNINITESTSIKNIYMKDISLPSGTTTLNHFGTLPSLISLNGWVRLTSDVTSYTNSFFILPDKASCIIAEDMWGNVTNTDVLAGIMTNSNITGLIYINTKSDLATYSYKLNGNVIFTNSITLDSNDPELVISGTAGKITFILFEAKNEPIKIINNGGKIKIDSTNSEIRFLGTGNAEGNDYKWFGFVNENNTSTLTFTGTNKVYFENAISPLSYLYPPDTITLNNLEFKNCFMGIHIYDYSNSYTKLTISNSAFTNLIYGIKFDFNTYTANTFDLGINLNKTGCTFTNIIRANVYSPIKGIEEK
ncbi:MAG: hypothetical protein A2Y34_05590 [Spirochaetes bacterium GWC1_27_15]|nr:MAG: hypothetical protein A2Z98_07190 [Spirochaetes bacterium GWB1_27_13]OHD22523.1 MAG: hypothetical protein A2Y34_05590 [Spirochaetes bacterium GWC1_27_15]